MGFDDILFDQEVLEKTKKICQDIVSEDRVGRNYHHEEMLDLQSLEENEKIVKYNAYSLCYHMLLPVGMANCIGAQPDGRRHPLCVAHTKLQTRLHAIECMIIGEYGDEEDEDDDPFDLDNAVSQFHCKLIKLYQITDTQVSEFWKKYSTDNI